MNKAAFNLLVDLLAAIALTVLVATGYMLWFVLPPGTNRTHELFGWLRHEWGQLHFWIAALLLAVLAVHVWLHWRWLSTGICKRIGLKTLAERSPAMAGTVALVIAAAPLATVIVAAHLRVKPLATPLHALNEAAVRPVPSGPGESTVAREREIAVMLETRCASCHGETDAADGVRADTIASLLIEQHGVRWVVPGDPVASPLFRVLRDEANAARASRRHVLPTQEFTMLTQWVRSLGQ